jgi:carboxypeptidase PM20D1
MKKIIAVTLLLGLIVLATALVVRTLSFTSKQGAPQDVVAIAVDERAAAERLAGALKFQTVSHQDPSLLDSAAFLDLHRYLEATYPLVHAQLSRETVSDLSLLYTWKGLDATADPVVLMGHLDVVPVDPPTLGDWTHPPYEGVISDGFVWGRGSMDDKNSVLAALEAVELLLRDEYQPVRTVFLAFGHDEELGGATGARRIAETLESHGVNDFALVLDEGGAVVDDMLPGIEGPTAIIGVAEKGFVSLELTTEGQGGHSSMPPPQTNIGILAKAITRLEEKQFPARLDGAALELFQYIGPEMGFLNRMLFANLWLFRPLVMRGLIGSPQTASMVRTTTAATIFHAGVKDNVLPMSASAMVNLRILPGETVETVAERVRQVIDDERVRVQISVGMDPSPVSDAASPSFQLLERTLRQVMPDNDLLVAPYLVMGGTDAKYYSGRSSNVFRFLPARVTEDDFNRIHGTDERLGVNSFATSIKFVYQLIRNLEEL